MSTISGVVIDMNGIFRHFRNEGAARGEALAGLPPGTMAKYAYAHPSYELAKVGVLTNEEWTIGVQRRLVKDFGEDANVALGPWISDRGHVDLEMLGLVSDLRKSVPVALLSNFTDALHSLVRRRAYLAAAQPGRELSDRYDIVDEDSD